MKQKLIPILLPTNNKSKIAYLPGAIENLGLSTEQPDFFIVPSGSQMHLRPEYQYLYLVSNTDIKKGEMAYDGTLNRIVMCPFNCKTSEDPQYLKVEASTDPQLAPPYISQEGLEYYIHHPYDALWVEIEPEHPNDGICTYNPDVKMCLCGGDGVNKCYAKEHVECKVNASNEVSFIQVIDEGVFDREKFADQIVKYTLSERFDAAAILLVHLPIGVEDLQEILSILKKWQERDIKIKSRNKPTRK